MRVNILWLISKRLKEVAVKEAETLADQISPQPMTIERSSVQQSNSVQTKNTPPIIVQDTDDNLMGMDKVKAGTRRHQQ